MNEDTTQLLKTIEQLQDLFAHEGWKQLVDLLDQSNESLRLELENAPAPNVHVLQGQIRSLRYVQNLPVTVELWRESATNQD